MRLSWNLLGDHSLLISPTPSDTDQVVKIIYDNNCEEVGPCVESTIECASCSFDIQYDIRSWYHGQCDSIFGYVGFDTVTQQNACVLDGFAYVEFDVDSVGYNEAYQTVVARYGESDCGAGASEAPAWKNSSTGMWNSTFYVGGIPNNYFYWQGKATFCEKTINGECRFQKKKPCPQIPPWFEFEKQP